MSKYLFVSLFRLPVRTTGTNADLKSGSQVKPGIPMRVPRTPVVVLGLVLCLFLHRARHHVSEAEAAGVQDCPGRSAAADQAPDLTDRLVPIADSSR